MSENILLCKLHIAVLRVLVVLQKSSDAVPVSFSNKAKCLALIHVLLK